MDILEKLISINTIKDKDNNIIIDYIESILKPLNFEFEEIGTEKKILIAKRGISNIGFICHTDTVDYHDWKYEPLKLTKDGDKLYGLGSSDMKGGIAALLNALIELPTNLPCICYFTYDEEIDFTGIKELVKVKNDFPKTLIFPEPTGEIFAIANKGCFEYKAEFRGKSAHSSNPNLGDNAILKSLCFINELNEFMKEIENEKDYLYEVPSTTFNLASVNGSSALNIIPDKCEIAFSYRTINEKIEKDILNKLNELSEKYHAKLITINNVSCAKSNADFKNIIKELFAKECIGLNYTTEASFFKDKNVLILGPGPVTAHECNEYIFESSFNNIKEYYKILIEKLSK